MTSFRLALLALWLCAACHRKLPAASAGSATPGAVPSAAPAPRAATPALANRTGNCQVKIEGAPHSGTFTRCRVLATPKGYLMSFSMMSSCLDCRLSLHIQGKPSEACDGRGSTSVMLWDPGFKGAQALSYGDAAALGAKAPPRCTVSTRAVQPLDPKAAPKGQLGHWAGSLIAHLLAVRPGPKGSLKLLGEADIEVQSE